MTAQTSDAANELLNCLQLEQIDTDLFRAKALPGPASRIFGGQIIGQALAAAGYDLGPASPSSTASPAASDTRPDRLCHSLHAYFLRAGDTSRPVIFQVLHDIDGGSFTHRRVVALQNALPILNLAASFHRFEDGLTHQTVAPTVPAPDQCPHLADALKASGSAIPPALYSRLDAFEMRPCLPVPRELAAPAPQALPTQSMWLRLKRPLRPDAALARAILAYASDFALLTTAMLPHDIPILLTRNSDRQPGSRGMVSRYPTH